MEEVLRQALALRVRSLRREVQRTLGELGWSGSEKSLRDALQDLAERGVVRLDHEVELISPGELHLATLELTRRQPELVSKHVHFASWGALRLDNRVRLQVYLDTPIDQTYGLAEFWACQYWAPPWEADFFFSRRPENQALILSGLRPALWGQGIWDERFDLLRDLLDAEVRDQITMELALARGRLEVAEGFLNPTLKRQGYDLPLLWMRGQAQKAYERALKLISRRKAGLPAVPPLVGVFARLAAVRAQDLELLGDERLSTRMPGLDLFFGELARHLAGQPSRLAELDFAGAGLDWCVPWSLRAVLPQRLDPDLARLQQLQRQGLHGWAEQLLQPAHPWGAGVSRQEGWRSWLSLLERRARQDKTPPAQPGELFWEVGQQGLRALHQHQGERQEISLAQLIRKPPDYLTDADHKVLASVERRQWGREVMVMDATPAVRALLGHPRVLFEGEPVRLHEVEQKLHLLRTAMGYKIDLKPRFGPGDGYRLRWKEAGVVEVCFPSRWNELLQPLLESGQEIPLGAEDELAAALAPWLEKLPVEYGPGVRPLAQTVEGGELVARLIPLRQSVPRGANAPPLGPPTVGLRFSWVWRVNGPGGPGFPLLSGPPREALHWNGQLLQVDRDFEGERVALAEVRQPFPGLPEELECAFSDPEEALEVVWQLQQSGVPCEWPESGPWRVREPVRRGDFRIQAESERDWFKLKGQWRVDEHLVLELGRTLQLLRYYPGRFVRLDEGDYVQVGQEIRRQLEALEELGDELKVSPLAVPALSELDLDLQTDERFRECLRRFSQNGYQPEPPPTLRLELRDYQLAGFQWLARRARAGVGCCLADDMGLGKTVQVLALMLLRRSQGPHLVVCPTSVMAHWRDQILRYTPSLQAVLYEGKDRGLDNLQIGQVVILSYRILMQDLEKLRALEWNVALLDEAQFIKNPESKTARAAYALKAAVRVATTGTPVENRLSELWSIFRFLNPGLLGSLASFRRRFETNLAVNLNASQRRLKRLVSPFLLRRSKSEVLSELPPRTEITLLVDLSARERSLYEQLRRQAEEGLRQQGSRFELLAHLTRLRQACSHPRLVLDQPGLTSSKLAAFFELLEDLRAGRHRCLVFSQFTRLLDLLQAELVERGVSFLRLDGSTPARERRSRVDAFQDGQSELFLISLKAGGTGLNLTAADYVVHLDPWWNPASEDQASDRAHRLGQTRPVTVYRLIARESVEEKVVCLHGHKRKMACDLLEGSHQEVDLGEQQLRELLR
ncbi:MAG: DEAD/DEAH box helicase [Candidatus Eremiobacteraeota bacterium]|nr:DEAD/DEAH box helicase [Candidatus Eremiobacteraeota bacterium]MCW5870838.1 DEAD/DEAH box helicase [Candidatus Eremiobacteraeota bacterium]